MAADWILNGDRRKAEFKAEMAARDAERDRLIREIDPEYWQRAAAKRKVKDSLENGGAAEGAAAMRASMAMAFGSDEEIEDALSVLDALRKERRARCAEQGETPMATSPASAFP